MNAREMAIWIVGLSLAALVLLAPVACTVNRQFTVAQAVAQAIERGADPIEAKCAIESDLEHSPMCILAASRPKKTNPQEQK